MSGQNQTVTTQDLTVLKVYHNDVPGPNWKPRVYDGVEQSFEPYTKVIAVPYGSPENAQQLEFKVKQAKFWMRGILRQGRGFTVSVKSGVTNGHSWSNFEDIVAELMADGTMKRVPESAKSPSTTTATAPAAVQAPAAATNGKPPQGATSSKVGTAPTAKPPVTAAGPAHPPADPPKPRPKPNEKFISYCFTPQTDAFYRMMEGFSEDNFVLGQANKMALEAAKFEIGWGNHARVMENVEAEALEGFNCTEGQFQERFKRWSSWFEWYLSERRWGKARDRFNNILENCLTKEQVISCVEMAWAKLPKTHYDLVREKARNRIAEIDAKKPPEPDAYEPTATPEVFEPADEFAEKENPPAAEVPAGAPAAEQVRPAVDQATVDFTVASMRKIKLGTTLWKYWEGCSEALKAHPDVRKEMALAICDVWDQLKYRQDADEMRPNIPAGILTPEQVAWMAEHYTKLEDF